MILLFIWLLMRFWDMSVHNKKRHITTTTTTTTNRECDTRCSCGEDDEVNRGQYISYCNSSRNDSRGDCNEKGTGFGRYLKGTNHFLRGLLAKIPLSQLFLDTKQQQRQQLSISQLLAEFGGLDTEAVRNELAFMGISEDLLNSRQNSVISGSSIGDFLWSQEYSFNNDQEEEEEDVNLLMMSASYEDMAKHLDAHLAELDIESFRAEDINSILNLKSFRGSSSGAVEDCRGRMRRSRIEEHVQLFSPPSGHYLSTDSLDHDGGDESLMLDSGRSELLAEGSDESIRVSAVNCQANKENYTLAFKDDSCCSGSTDSHESCLNGGRKVSWNKLGNNNSNNSDQSLDSSGSFVGGWNLRRRARRRSTPTEEEAFQLSNHSPRERREEQNMNLVKMFMKQRTLSTSSTATDLPQANVPSNAGEGEEEEEFSLSSRHRKRSMNDSGKCSTLSQHVLDEEEEEEEENETATATGHRVTDDYQLDSLDVVQSSAAQAVAPHQQPSRGPRRDKQHQNQRSLILQRQNSKSIQTSTQPLWSPPEKVIVFPECRLPSLDFVHLEHEVLTSQFVSNDQLNQLNGSHPNGFEHIVDWDSLLFLLSREHKEMLKRYPVLGERIRNSFQDSAQDVFDEFPETIDVTFEAANNVCDCDSLISSTASNNSSNRYSSDSGLGPNTYNFEDLRKLFVYEYNEEGDGGAAAVKAMDKGQQKNGPVRRYRERRYTMCSMPVAAAEEERQQQEKRVSFQAGLPKKRTNKSTSSIPRLITKTVARGREEAERERLRTVSRIPKLIKSPSKVMVGGK